jgi:hypothetical protein
MNGSGQSIIGAIGLKCSKYDQHQHSEQMNVQLAAWSLPVPNATEFCTPAPG